jgi:serine/threonine-protein kinase
MTMSKTQQNLPGTDQTVVVKITTLADVLKERGALPEPELLKTFLQVLDDLELAHSQAMLHRDISPARIVLHGETWKLADYGVAKVGTVKYMSPERCQGKPLDVRSDTYSLGVVLFEAATGRVPFDAELKFQIMNAQVGSPPPSPRAIKSTVSAELERVILRALSKNPTGRFQTAGEFKLALEAVVRASGRPSATSTRPSATAPVRGEPEAWSGPKRVKPAAILVPLALIIVAAAGYFLLKGGVGTPRVPSVIGMGKDEAEQALRGKGFGVEIESADDTLLAGTVVAQVPAAGEKVSGSRVVALKVSSGMVAVPVLAGLTLAEARARLAELALTAAKIDSQYNDSHGAGVVVSSGAKAGTRLVPRSRVNLTVSNGRATCPQCGARREAGAKFCTKCGYKF